MVRQEFSRDCTSADFVPARFEVGWAIGEEQSTETKGLMLAPVVESVLSCPLRSSQTDLHSFVAGDSGTHKSPGFQSPCIERGRMLHNGHRPDFEDVRHTRGRRRI